MVQICKLSDASCHISYLYLIIHITDHSYNKFLKSSLAINCPDFSTKGVVTRNDSQGRFLAQHSFAMLEQCNNSKQRRINVAMPCCAEIVSCNITFTVKKDSARHA